LKTVIIFAIPFGDTSGAEMTLQLYWECGF